MKLFQHQRSLVGTGVLVAVGGIHGVHVGRGVNVAVKVGAGVLVNVGLGGIGVRVAVGGSVLQGVLVGVGGGGTGLQERRNHSAHNTTTAISTITMRTFMQQSRRSWFMSFSVSAILRFHLAYP